MFYYLSIPEFRRGPEFRFPRAPSFSWPLWHLLSDTIHCQQGVSIVDQLIACKQWDSPISGTINLLYQPIGVRLRSLANNERWQQLRYRVKTQPDPGITIVRKDLL